MRAAGLEIAVVADTEVQGQPRVEIFATDREPRQRATGSRQSGLKCERPASWKAWKYRGCAVSLGGIVWRVS